MLENTNTKQFYPGPILNRTLEITKFLFRNPEQVRLQKTALDEHGNAYDIELTYGTDYEVQKVLPNDINIEDANLTASTGQITLKSTVEVKEGEKLTAYRESALVQDTDYPRTGKFPAASHEGALDYLTMQNQEQQEQINRTLKIPVSIQNFNAQMPIPLPAKALKINATGDGFEMSEYDPDIALITTKEYAQNAQDAANAALASQSAAASSSQSAMEQATIATMQATIATEQATIATEQAGIATAKTSEVVESGNNALTAITEQETTSKNNIETKGVEQIELIQNEGATQIANVQSTGFYMRDDKLYFINSQGEETEFKSGGSGFEVGDIGMALYVDETKGLRRYLNGQIVERNDNTQAFFTRLQEITTLHPSLLCTEEEWQTAKTMSAFGQVGKFVFNYSGDKIVSVRIPRVVNVQGLFDLQNLGMTVSAGLPNITGYFNALGGTPIGGAFFNGSTGNTAGEGSAGATGVNMDASRSSVIYGNSNTVQEEAIQYPYFIQIATGQETENNIVNDIELNNPYSLFECKYADHELFNLSWLVSNDSYNGSNAVHPSAYQALLVENNAEVAIGSTVTLPNGVKYTKQGLSVKLSTDSDITDYDFRLNTTEETFGLPLKNGNEHIPDYSNGIVITSTNAFIVPSNGVVAGTIDTGQRANKSIIINGRKIESVWGGDTAQDGCPFYAEVKKGDSVVIERILTDEEFAKPTFYPFVGNGSLYYYVGETVQNANLIDAGRIEEIKANRSELDGNIVIKFAENDLGKKPGSGEIITISLDDYLPKDGNIYEVLISGGSATDYNSWVYIYLGSDLIENGPGKYGMYFMRATSFSSTRAGQASGQCWLPVGLGRYITIYNTVNGTAPTSTVIMAHAYRKVR